MTGLRAFRENGQQSAGNGEGASAIMDLVEYGDRAAFDVNIPPPQAAYLADPESAAIQKAQKQPVAQTFRRVQDGPHFLGAHHARNSQRMPRPANACGELGAAKPVEDGAKDRDVRSDPVGGETAIAQVMEVGPDVAASDLGGAAVAVCVECAQDVAIDPPRGGTVAGLPQLRLDVAPEDWPGPRRRDGG